MNEKKVLSDTNIFVYISKSLCHKYLEILLLHFPVQGASPYI